MFILILFSSGISSPNIELILLHKLSYSVLIFLSLSLKTSLKSKNRYLSDLSWRLIILFSLPIIDILLKNSFLITSFIFLSFVFFSVSKLLSIFSSPKIFLFFLLGSSRFNFITQEIILFLILFRISVLDSSSLKFENFNLNL